MQQAVARLEILPFPIWDEPGAKGLVCILQSRKCTTTIISPILLQLLHLIQRNCSHGELSGTGGLTHRSPHTLCRFRLGLRPGVLSLCRLELSTSFSLLDNASASIASDTSRVEGDPISTLASDRLVGTVGGVFDRGGVSRCGVSGRSEVAAMAIGFSMRPSVFYACLLSG